MEEATTKSEQELKDAPEQQKESGWQEMLKKMKVDDFKFELTLFLILGFLLGFTIKTEAVKKITIGFNDYKITRVKQSYDFAALKEALDAQSAQKQDAASAPDNN